MGVPNYGMVIAKYRNRVLGSNYVTYRLHRYTTISYRASFLPRSLTPSIAGNIPVLHGDILHVIRLLGNWR
jgi:hypothetical protein